MRTPAFKTCLCCQKRKPLNAKGTFDEDTTSPDGYADVCNPCIMESISETLRTHSKQTAAGMDELMRGDLQTELATLTCAPATSDYTPHIATMFESMMRQFGGPDGLARCIKSTYLAAPQGSHTRAKILSDLQKMGMAVTEEGRSRSIDQMDDEEIKITHDRVMKRLTAKVVDVTLSTDANSERETDQGDSGQDGLAGARHPAVDESGGGSGAPGTGSPEAVRASGLAG